MEIQARKKVGNGAVPQKTTGAWLQKNTFFS